MSSSFRLVYWIGLWSHWAWLSVLQAPLYLRTLWCYVSVFKNYAYWYLTLPCRGLGLVGLALYLVDWPTVVLHCWLGHLTHKNRHQYDCNVFGGRDVKPYSTSPHHSWDTSASNTNLINNMIFCMWILRPEFETLCEMRKACGMKSKSIYFLPEKFIVIKKIFF